MFMRTGEIKKILCGYHRLSEAMFIALFINFLAQQPLQQKRHMSVLTYSTLGKTFNRHIEIFFLFPQQTDLTFQANCLHRICMKCRNLFSGKKYEKYFKMLPVDIFTQSAKHLHNTSRFQTVQFNFLFNLSMIISANGHILKGFLYDFLQKIM